MTKRISSKTKLSRQFESGKELWSFCIANKNTKQKKLNKLFLVPGEHAYKRKKETERREKRYIAQGREPIIEWAPRNKTQSLNFTLNLKAKQKLKRYYGNITEKQFKKLYYTASSYKGNITNNFISLLERRLDTVLFRINFAPSIFSARQLVSHGHILVNKKAVNIASYSVKDGDLIEVKKASYNFISTNILTKLKNLQLNQLQNKILTTYPNYIDVNYKTLSAVFLYSPTITDVTYHNNNMELKRITQFYN